MQDEDALRLYNARKIAMMDFNNSMRGAKEKGKGKERLTIAVFIYKQLLIIYLLLLLKYFDIN